MKELLAFLSAFRDSNEVLHLRAFKPSGAPFDSLNSPKTWTTAVAAFPALWQQLVEANRTRGIYFVVNAGGDSDFQITRYTAFFAEDDERSIGEQHRRLESAPIKPSIRVETRKSVHAYWLVGGLCSEAEWREVQTRLIEYFGGDPKIKNPSRVMRLPGFDHLHLNRNVLERKKVNVHTFDSERRYSVSQMREAFPWRKNKNGSEPLLAYSAKTFEYHEDRHAELCERIRARGRLNSKGNWDANCLADNGKGPTGMVYFPTTGAVKCNAEPACDYFSQLRAEGLPDGHLDSRDSTRRTHSRGLEEPKDISLAIVKMSDVEAKEVQWLWYPYIALGKLTLLEGDPGLGKSWITVALACAISRGHQLQGMRTRFEFGRVLMLSAEDGLADTVRPRLDAVGADTTRIFALSQTLTFDETGLRCLEAEIIKYKPRLLTVDPLFAFTGGKVDIHRANECRTITARLAQIAEKQCCAVVAVRHLGKSRGMGHALNAGIGSIDLTAAARSVLLVGKDPSDDSKRALVQIKSNLAPHGPAIGFTVKDGRFCWTGRSDLTAEEILSYATNERERPALAEGTEFLRECLSTGGREVSEVKAEARQAGISEITLRRARQGLGIRAQRSGMPGTKQTFSWSLGDVQPRSDDAHK